MKTKKLLVAAFIAVALLLVASCSIPDYQLGWAIGVPTQSVNNVLIDYTIENIGYEKLYDATIRISVSRDGTQYHTWTSPVDLPVGAWETGTVSINIYGTPYDINTEAVTGAGWNAESKTW